MKKHLILSLATSALLAFGLGVTTSDPTASNVQKTQNKPKVTSLKSWEVTKKSRPRFHVYQNPKRYYQVQYNQIKGAKEIPTVGTGWEGMRTYKFTHKYGLPDNHNYFTSYDSYFVRNFQRRHHLHVTAPKKYEI